MTAGGLFITSQLKINAPDKEEKHKQKHNLNYMQKTCSLEHIHLFHPKI